MIKNFIQKHKVILLAVVITSLAISAVASGYFVIKNEKKSASQKIESLQKSIEELQTKAENPIKSNDYQEVDKKEEAVAPPETTQQAPTKKNVGVAPIKEELEEKIVSCVAFDGSALEVTEDECNEIKQKNVVVQKALDKYDACVSDAEDDLSDAKEEYQDSMNDGYDPYIVEKYNNSVGEYNGAIKSCVKARNSVVKKLTD